MSANFGEATGARNRATSILPFPEVVFRFRLRWAALKIASLRSHTATPEPSAEPLARHLKGNQVGYADRC
jgi:hypothetical protein